MKFTHVIVIWYKANLRRTGWFHDYLKEHNCPSNFSAPFSSKIVRNLRTKETAAHTRRHICLNQTKETTSTDGRWVASIMTLQIMPFCPRFFWIMAYLPFYLLAKQPSWVSAFLHPQSRRWVEGTCLYSMSCWTPLALNPAILNSDWLVHSGFLHSSTTFWRPAGLDEGWSQLELVWGISSEIG